MHIDDADIGIEEAEQPSADRNKADFVLPLSEFLECFTPPQCGRIVEGQPQDFDAYAAFDIPKGCSLTFYRKLSPNVSLSFQDSWGAGQSDVAGAAAGSWLKVTVPTDYLGRFELLPYDPVSGDTRPDHIYHTVEELVRAFPVYVQANASYGDRILDSRSSLSCGDRLKLLRLVCKDGQKYLECRLLSEPKLLLLPMTCTGDFTALPDNNSYMLSDLLALPPRRRRVRQSQDSANNKLPPKIAGLPDKYAGELYLEEPEAFIEASPVTDSGLIIGLPSDLDLFVYPDDAGQQGQLFSSFVNANRNLFPVTARVVDWGQETSILENHRIRPGTEIVIHGWTKQSKVLAVSGNNYYTIPLTYTGTFRIKPKRYEGVTELERAYPGNKLRVVSVDPEDNDFPLQCGDIIRIKREDTLKRKTLGEVEIKCERYDSNGGKSKEIKLPLGSPAVFEEILDDDGRGAEFSIKELVSFVTDQELVVEVTKRSSDQKVKNRDFDVGSSILLCDFVIEPAVYVSVDTADAPAFHIPLRTLIYVVFVYQLDKSASPLLTKSNPRLSTLDRCAELISSEVFTSLRPQRALDTVESFGRAATQSPAQSWVTDASSTGTSAWPTGLSASRDFDLLSGKARKPPSVAESDAELTKSKGLSKLKNKFRRHKSQENVFRSNSPANVSRDFPPLSVAKQDVEYTQSSVNDNVILAERSVSVKNGQLHVTTQDPFSKGSFVSGSSSVELNGEGSQSLSSASTPRSLTSAARPTATRTSHTRSTAQVVNHVATNQKQATNNNTSHQNGVNGVNSVNGVNGMHTQSSIASISSDGGSSLPSPQPLQVPPGYALVQAQSVLDSPGNGSLNSVPQLPEGLPGYMLVPIISPKMLDGIQRLYRNHSLSSGADDEDDDDDDYGSVVQDMSLKKAKLKFTLPPDGNLYHFSVKKMGSFLRQLRIDDDVIENCVKQKLDGKKFSKLGEDDLKKFGILHPVVIHFRRLTVKTKPKFML